MAKIDFAESERRRGICVCSLTNCLREKEEIIKKRNEIYANVIKLKSFFVRDINNFGIFLYVKREEDGVNKKRVTG